MSISATKTSGAPKFSIIIKGLCKTYAASNKQPAQELLKEINLQNTRSSDFAFLGPNGVGKSTLVIP